MSEPVEIRNDRENGRVVVVWDDGARSMYPLDDLRNACPCAGCRGHSPGEVEPPKVKGVGLLNIAEVGSYAIRFAFSDGHDTGIYTFKYLRDIGAPMLA
ncbi:MAG: DUF971 domain-containing protein [Deltaproteobacteria bacterium]|nr:DUF971 domain-containing protein [Deltaproteobacteria bacterium]